MKRALLIPVALIAMSVQGVGAETLRWSSAGDALTLDPHAEPDASTRSINGMMYEFLVSRDPDLNLVPALATEWGPVEGENAWLLKLREGVTFHEGQTFTAEDVKFSIERAKSPSSAYKSSLSSIESMEVIGDHVIKLNTNGPNPILPSQLGLVLIMDQQWSEEHGVTEPQDFQAKEETYAIRHANGTGPYKLELRAPEEQTVMVKNENWWGWESRPGNVDRIEYRPISNAATRVAALLSGEVDFLLDPPLQDLDRIKSTKGLTVDTVPEVRTIFMGMKLNADELASSNIKGKNPFQDLKVRQAFSHALDLEAIKRVVMNGLSFPTGMITAPSVLGSTPELDKPFGFDADKAKALMAEAGYADGFSVQLDCPNNRYVNDEKICQAVVGMLARIGVKVKLDAVPKNLHFTKIGDRNTDLFLLGWGVPTLDSQYVMEFLLEKGGRTNAAGYDDPKVNDLIKQIKTELDPDKRLAMIQEVWHTVRDDAIYIPMHHQVIAWAMVDKLSLPISANNDPLMTYAVISK